MSIKTNQELRNHITQKLTDLHIKQNTNGSFTGYSFTEHGESKVSETSFTTSLILSALTPLKTQKIYTEILTPLTEAGTSYILQNEEVSGTWNYWEKSSTARKHKPYPDDADDTFLALASLFTYTKEGITGERLSHIVRLLFSIELTEGGPYNTWFCDFNHDPKWKDCDPGVNANISYVLSLLDITLPNMDSYFENEVLHGSFISNYYPPLMVIYFISRSYRGQMNGKYVEKIISFKNVSGNWGNPLLTAISLSALARFGENMEKHIDAYTYLFNLKDLDVNEVAYIEENKEDIWYHGSPELTIAFIIEAYSYLYTEENISEFKNQEDILFLKYTDDISTVSKEFEVLSKKYVQKIVNNQKNIDGILLPFHFAKALGVYTEEIDQKLLNLCLSGIHGWIGYTLLDDILDGQMNIRALPFAVYSIRQCTTLYSELFLPDSISFISLILKNTDIAYHTEQVQKCCISDGVLNTQNIPDVQEIPSFEKSLGLALPTIGVLSIISHEKRHELGSMLICFFSLYLKIKQSIDDEHDIIEDISQGRITAIVSRILSYIQTKYPERTSLSIHTDSMNILDIFWKHVFPHVHAENMKDLHLAQEQLFEMKLTDDTYFKNMLLDLEKILTKTHMEYTNAQSFIASYTA